jgi:ribosomal protein S27AE
VILILKAFLVCGLLLVAMLFLSAANHVPATRTGHGTGRRQIRRSPRGTYELLTEDEKDHILTTNRCPDCGTGTLLRGPEGGFQTVKCASCSSMFNLGPTLGQFRRGEGTVLFGSHRVGRP